MSSHRPRRGEQRSQHATPPQLAHETARGLAQWSMVPARAAVGWATLVRILLVAEGNPETWDSWSGSSRGLLRALRAQGHDVITGDVSEPAWRRWPNILRNWVPDRRHCAARYHFGPIGFRNRGRRAEALLARYAGASAVFVMSDYLRRSMVTDFGLAEDRVETVLAGANLDLGAIPPLPTTPPGPPTILFVGKQWERKGGPLLLEAFRGVRRAVSDARLLIVGCTPPIAGAHELGVEIVGPVAKHAPNGQARLSALYQSADVFCMPSQFEPFGVVFVEAMLHGLPCVGSNRCAIPEIIAHGETGWVVPGDDAASLRDTLVAALASRGEDSRHGMRRACRERALRLFTWERVAERMARVMSRHIAPLAVAPAGARA